jgi:hypothetical protein
MRNLPRPDLGFIQWLLLLAGLGLLCASAWLWVGVTLGLATIGVSCILTAFLTTLTGGQVPR